MAYFVGDHIRLREVARRAEARFQVAVEREVDVHALVERTVEGTHRRLPHAALRAHCVAEEHQLRLGVIRARLPEHFLPDVLGAGEHLGDELAHLVGGRALGAGLLLRLSRRHLLGRIEHDRGIHAEEHGDQRDHHAADAQAAADADSAPVLYIAAAALASELHVVILRLSSPEDAGGGA
jgi:hypothetical protein